MKVSELIIGLNVILADYGDIEVTGSGCDDCCVTEITSLEYLGSSLGKPIDYEAPGAPFTGPPIVTLRQYTRADDA